jgi:pilus assembly protein Flp/PilA
MSTIPQQSRTRARFTAEDGQALVEYALILMLVALVAVGVLTTIGVNVVTALTSVANGL